MVAVVPSTPVFPFRVAVAASRAVGRVEGVQDMTAEEVLKASLRFLAF